MSQEQFLNVIDRDEAERRFRAALRLEPLGPQTVPLEQALGRVLAGDVVAGVNVPSFDRSNYDGYAVRAADTFGAAEERPVRLALLPEVLATGVVPTVEVTAGTAVGIATGGMLPRGADAVAMVEHSDSGSAGQLLVFKAVTPGFGVSFAATDIAVGETVVRRGETITSRESGVLAAIGLAQVDVWRRPRVAILSTGDELLAPGEAMQPGRVYDSNARILADAATELGAEPLPLGIVPDDAALLRARLTQALESADVVLLSGGTSKGGGDLSYRVVGEVCRPGIVAHGVALKPGKPICLAAHHGKPVVVLPGFPTSAIFTFHEFVAPVIRRLGGRCERPAASVSARLPVRVNSEIGRTEYLLVGLMPAADGELVAYPLGQGSGSVTTFSRADGFVTIGRHEELVEAGTAVAVQLLADDLRPADLVAIGSHCVGLDYLLGRLQDQGFHTKFLAVGSTAGLEAARRGECDLAGMHLLDPATGQYNRPLLTPGLELIAGYGRLQGIVFRRDDSRLTPLLAGSGTTAGISGATAGLPSSAANTVGRKLVSGTTAAVSGTTAGLPSSAPVTIGKDLLACLATMTMVNRNAGSGTRILIDRLLTGRQPPGYAVQPRSHHAVAAAVAQGRADWGVAIEWVARQAGLGFLPLEEEQYDFVAPQARLDRPAVVAFRRLLAEPPTRDQLRQMGFRVPS